MDILTNSQRKLHVHLKLAHANAKPMLLKEVLHINPAHAGC
jgi:hypothetical protein